MDTVVEELSISLSNLVKWISVGAIVFGGIVPYIPQYKEIKRTEDTEGFSLFVCLTLLIANTLRIFFWFGKQYELPLLIQSVIMNITMLAMIHLCVNIRNKNQIIRNKDRVFSGGGYLSVFKYLKYQGEDVYILSHVLHSRKKIDDLYVT